MQDPVRVGLLGCGNVGAPLVRLLDGNADRIAARAGVAIDVTRVAVRDASRSRDVKLGADRFTADAASVVADPNVDVVVEVIGGLDPARQLITAALEAGKPVVTANKELIAQHGPELFETAARAGVDLLFEASVAGGIPLMRPLRESLAGDRIHRVVLGLPCVHNRRCLEQNIGGQVAVIEHECSRGGDAQGTQAQPGEETPAV